MVLSSIPLSQIAHKLLLSKKYKADSKAYSVATKSGVVNISGLFKLLERAV